MLINELKRLFASHGLANAFEEQKPLFLWGEVMGPNIARLTDPTRVHQGVLHIQVGNHVVAQEYTMMREVFLEKLNAHLDQPLKDIKFHVATLDRPAAPSPKMPQADEVELSSEENDSLESIVDEIEDESLKQSLLGLLQTFKKTQAIRSDQENQKQCPECGMFHNAKETHCAYCRLEGRAQE
jgi:hypothetical protein